MTRREVFGLALALVGGGRLSVARRPRYRPFPSARYTIAQVARATSAGTWLEISRDDGLMRAINGYPRAGTLLGVAGEDIPARQFGLVQVHGGMEVDIASRS